MIASMRVLVIACLLLGCHNETSPAAQAEADPPFDVRGEAEGLLLVWFDGEGLHTANRRSDIPEERRASVRVDDLSLPPDDRLDPEQVFVADLSRARGDGSYAVRQMPRSSFDAMVSRAAGETETAEVELPSAALAGNADGEVVIYGASWCSACRSAAAFLRQRNVPFVERDIEREPGAREAMMRAAEAAGVRTTGIPVIDFRGRIIRGFDQPALERAIEETGGATI
jgi:glutaredoxin